MIDLNLLKIFLIGLAVMLFGAIQVEIGSRIKKGEKILPGIYRNHFWLTRIFNGKEAADKRRTELIRLSNWDWEGWKRIILGIVIIVFGVLYIFAEHAPG